MAFFKNLLTCALAFSSIAAARPTRRQAPALTDLQILQFALTLEHLEATFYKEGFAKFPASDFKALGLDDATIAGLVSIGETEATHVTVLQQTITSLGGSPVPACTYNFNLIDAASMVATARILEAVGISAYLGAAPLVSAKAVLSAAASIVTVEARHQTFIRASLKALPVPQAFDVAVGARQIFTLASQFIVACPKEADLGLAAFAPLNVLDAGNVRAGSTLKMVVTDPTGGAGMSCSFTSGEKGLQFAKFENGGCVVPEGLGGEVFMTVTTESAGVTALSDDKIVAGPAVLVLS
ncbi:ferritin-like domain-containing protein [Sphaerosporella brunnea]|uniref:Ferritin-like domain-containing protein n=1 Tax=Sphaerosporella brunnea TaxID=1250544 RepID=A0A5J5EU79_9PEZI|nr:ferritin-like domain-containing protein [Sphaerosporella brunnea]